MFLEVMISLEIFNGKTMIFHDDLVFCLTAPDTLAILHSSFPD